VRVSCSLLKDLTANATLPSDSESFFREMGLTARNTLRAEYIVIALFDKMTQELYYNYFSFNDKISSNLKHSAEDFKRIPFGTGLIGWCAKEKKTINISNPHKDLRFRPEIDEVHGRKIRSLLVVPLISRNQLLGVLEAVNKIHRSSFSKQDMELFKFIGMHMAIQMDNEALFQQNLNLEQLSGLGQGILNSAHGLKNILNNLDGGTYIVERGILGQKMENIDKGWDIIKRNSQRLRDLVLEILLFSRPRKPEYKLSDLNKICRELVELMTKTAAQHHVKLKFQLDPEITSNCVDPKGIYRCLLNLVNNAIYACKQKQGGTVTLITQQIGPEIIQIIVKDTGTGINEENLKHIFDIFFTTKGSMGTGLGLPVSKKIISEHKGTIDVQSEPGIGTTFIIRLPQLKAGFCL
jgi:signal transduction histidine kinase